MLRKLRSKLAAAAVAVVLAAGSSGVVVSAQGNTFSAVLDVAPGERRCINHPTQAFRNASVYDYVMSGAMVKFIFLGSREISNSGYPVLSYYDYVEAEPSFPPSFFPSLFPGFFRTCARNDSYQPSTVYLSLTVDQ